MKTCLTLLFISLVPFMALSQQLVRGAIEDPAGQPVIGANVYLLDTYDGTSTDEKGAFSFKTSETGEQILVASAIGYVTWQNNISLDHELMPFSIRLEEETTRLDDLVISAGIFEASDEKKSVTLRPLDIVTTAGATADIPGVLNTMPGTQTVGEKGRLFVRGGESGETGNFIDGMLVAQAYGLSPENIPSRMRFSPFLFSGTSFSTGGYSAEYGQALSGTLILKTDDEAVRTQTDLSLMSVGGAVAHTQKWDNSSVFIETAYTDLTPYFYLVPQQTEWAKAPGSWQNTLVYRKNIHDKSRFKLFYAGDLSAMSLDQPNPLDVTELTGVELNNKYHHLSTNYEGSFRNHGQVYAGLSGTFSDNRTDMEFLRDNEITASVHAKTWIRYDAGGMAAIKIGMDTYSQSFQRETALNDWQDAFRISYSEWLPGLFVESDLSLTEKIVGRIGLRGEYSSLAERSTLSPRISLAYRTAKHSQVSFATGIFRQRPEAPIRSMENSLKDELALHYILNYQWVRDLRTFRIEGYFKEYRELVTYEMSAQAEPENFANSGYGHARGIDIFWRDSETLRNVDYWISYSYMDTERLYRDFPEQAVPAFASRHNLSVVYKHFIAGIRSQAGATFTWTSGRPYNDPNSAAFNASTTPAYIDLSLNYSYLLKTNFIIHFSVTNLLGADRVFGYQYSLLPDEDGTYAGIKVGQPAKRFIFLGMFWTLSRDRNANQLRNL